MSRKKGRKDSPPFIYAKHPKNRGVLVYPQL